MTHHTKWPRCSVVEVRRIQMGKLHAFVLTCGHAILIVVRRSVREELSEFIGYKHCYVCHAEQKRGIEPLPPLKISLDYLDTLIEKNQ